VIFLVAIFPWTIYVYFETSVGSSLSFKTPENTQMSDFISWTWVKVVILNESGSINSSFSTFKRSKVSVLKTNSSFFALTAMMLSPEIEKVAWKTLNKIKMNYNSPQVICWFVDVLLCPVWRFILYNFFCAFIAIILSNVELFKRSVYYSQIPKGFSLVKGPHWIFSHLSSPVKVVNNFAV